MKASTIAILGAGSWGSAVAIHLAHSGHHVHLWGRDTEQMASMAKARENTRYLPGILFPDTLTPTSLLSDCTEAEHLIIAVPSHAFAELISQLSKPRNGIAWLTKGIDPQNHLLLSQLLMQQWGDTLFPMVSISGPSFANEVARHLPTALVIAGNNLTYSEAIRNIFQQKTVRAYLSHDLIGVQLCGAIKNVLAIACGISDGLMYGANAKAALITRGLAEMTRLGAAFGAEPSTFVGLAGLGDLVLTCTDNQSRNRRFGLLLGQGVSIPNAEKQVGQVVEGRFNAEQVCALAQNKQIDLPICSHVAALLRGELTAKQAAEKLMDRPLRQE